MGNFGSLLGNTTLAIKKRGELSNAGIEQSSYNMTQDIKDQQRAAMFATINEVLGIADVVHGNLSESSDIKAFAEGEGFSVSGSLYSRVFGDQKFERNGKSYSSQDILGLKALREYERQRSLMSEEGY